MLQLCVWGGIPACAWRGDGLRASCVFTDIGGAERFVGDTGYVVAPGNPAALASAWQVALEAGGVEKASRSQRARERIIEHFSLERLIEETARVLAATVKTGAQGMI